MATAEKVEAKNEKAPSIKSIGLLDHTAVEEISGELRHLLADTFALYLKTKNFHWHMTGKHFRDYHLLLDEHADQIFAMTDPVAERARKLGGITLHSISEITSHQRLKDNNGHHLPPKTMLSELYADNRQLTASLRSLHELCDHHNDVATASLIEVWIDETERRAWFLGEIIDSVDSLVCAARRDTIDFLSRFGALANCMRLSFEESRTRGSVWGCVAGNPGTRAIACVSGATPQGWYRAISGTPG